MGPFELSAHLTVRPGCLEGFKKQAAECIRTTKEKDTHCATTGSSATMVLNAKFARHTPTRSREGYRQHGPIEIVER
jgi:hypothetical protein